MELTKEHFDQHIKLTREYSDQQFKLAQARFDEQAKLTKEHFDEKFKDVATKDDLKDGLRKQTIELKAYADDQTEKLARIIARTIANPMEIRFNKLEKKLPIVERVQVLETGMRKIKTALHLS